MAKNEENYNNSVLGYLDSIENDKLDKISYAVTQFVKAYNKQILEEQRESSKKQTETIKVLKESEKSRKADAVQSAALAKQTAKNSELQAKTVEKILENSLDAKNAQETLKKIQESSAAAMKATNQEIIKGLTELSNLSSENVSYAEKLNNMTAEMQKDNAQARLQDMLKDTKRFRLESKYWKNLTGGIKGLSAEFHDFKNNPKRWMADAMGNLLGQAIDKTIDGFSKSMKIFGDSLKQFSDDILNVIKEREKKAEDLSRSTLKDFEITKGFQNALTDIGFKISRQKGSGFSGTDFMAVQDTLKDLIAETIGVKKFQAMSQEKQAEIVQAYTKDLIINQEHAVEEIRKSAQKYGNDTDKIIKETRINTQLAGEVKSIENARVREFADLARNYSMEDFQKMGIIAENEAEARLKFMREIEEIAVKRGADFTAKDLEKILELNLKVQSQNFIESLNDEQQLVGRQLIGELKDASKKGISALTDKVINSVHSDIVDIPVLQQMYGSLTDETNQNRIRALQNSKRSKEDYESDLEELKAIREKDFTKENLNWASDKTSMESNVKMWIERIASLQVDENATQEQKDEARRRAVESLIQDRLLKINPEKYGELSPDNLELFTKTLQNNLDIDENGKLKYTIDGLNSALKDLPQELQDAGAEIFQENILKDMESSVSIMSSAVNLMKLKNDVGLDIDSGDLFGSLIKSGIQASISGTFDERYKTKYYEMFQELIKVAQPIFDKLKGLLVDPILNTIGGILGDIYDWLQERFTIGDRTEEEKVLARNKFKTGEQSIEKTESRVKSAISNPSYAKAYYKDEKTGEVPKELQMLLEKAKSGDLTLQEVNNANISDEARRDLQIYAAMNSENLWKGDRIGGSNEITKILKDDFVKTKLDMIVASKYATDRQSLANLVGESDEVASTIEFLAKDRSINASKLKNMYDVIHGELGWAKKGTLMHMVEKTGITPPDNMDAEDAAAWLAYFLLKENMDLWLESKDENLAQILFGTGVKAINKIGDLAGVGINMDYSDLYFMAHNNDAKNHFALNSISRNGMSSIKYFEDGGVVAATKGGQQIIVGEAGHDEIILPTDPAKQKRAQELLTLAQDKYGLYAKDPDNIDAKLKQQMADLLLDLRILMIQLNPMTDVIAMQKVMQAFSMLKNASVIANPSSDTSSDVADELIGGGVPTLGEPIKDAANLGAIRNAIIEEAKKYTGTQYALAPAGLVCNQLVNAAYAGVLGKKNYAEMLRTLGYAHDEMHTISGFIPEIRKGSNDKVLLASSQDYATLASRAKPGDLVFSSNTGKTVNGLNPDNHGHVNLFIDKDSKIDSTSMKINGKDGVGVHKPGKGPHMLMNLLDNMPESWYASKGLLKSTGVEDSSTMTSHYVNSSTYDPSLQSTPNASYVSDQVSRADQAKIEKERRIAERQNKTAMEQVTEVINNLGIKLTGMDMKRQISVNIPQDKTFCTSGMSSSSGTCYSVAR